jgi:hypothetical protein
MVAGIRNDEKTMRDPGEKSLFVPAPTPPPSQPLFVPAPTPPPSTAPKSLSFHPSGEPDIVLKVPDTSESVDCGKLPSQCVDSEGNCVFASQIADHQLPAQPPGLDVKDTNVFCAQVCGLCGKHPVIFCVCSSHLMNMI